MRLAIAAEFIYEYMSRLIQLRPRKITIDTIWMKQSDSYNEEIPF